jgi:hypothetical protein
MDIEKLQKNLNRLGELAIENEMKANPDKSRAVSFTKAKAKEQTRYFLRGTINPGGQSL